MAALRTTALSPTQQLRAGNSELWQAALQHPFVAGIATGTVPPGRFRRYIQQDQLYLTTFARCLGLGVAKSRDTAEMRLFGTLLDSLLTGEALSNDSLLAALAQLCGPDSGTPPEPLPQNRAYMDFLLAAAYAGDALDILTALLPCAWMYAEIGAAWLPQMTEHPVYSDWLRYLTGPEYTSLTELHLTAVDERAAALAPEDVDRLARIFRTACALELDFWDMAQES